MKWCLILKCLVLECKIEFLDKVLHHCYHLEEGCVTHEHRSSKVNSWLTTIVCNNLLLTHIQSFCYGQSNHLLFLTSVWNDITSDEVTTSIGVLSFHLISSIGSIAITLHVVFFLSSIVEAKIRSSLEIVGYSFHIPEVNIFWVSLK